MVSRAYRLERKACVVVALVVVGAMATWVVYAGEPSRRKGGETEQQTLERTAPRLRAALSPQSSGAGSTPASSQSQRTTTKVDRAPVRGLKSPYAAYSAVAVDATRDEIVLQDENRFNLMVYNRLDNTPPTATMTEPKRIIGGPRTKLGKSNCGVYVDPSSGDIFSVSNDVENFMTIFSREARGNVPPTRELATPHRTFGIAVDEEGQELYLTIQHPAAVLVWRKTAQGNEAPLRILQGDKTQLADALGIALDPKNQLMFVSNRGAGSRIKEGMGFSGVPVVDEEGVRSWVHPDVWYEYYRERFVPGSGWFAPPSITVYPLKAEGNAPPQQVIQGPKTQLNWPAHIHIDLARQEILVADAIADAILVFRETDNGNVAPVRVLKGPKTKLKNPHGVFVDEKNQEIVVANFGNHSATVYPRTAAGDTPPIRVIRSAPEGTQYPLLGKIGAMAYDTKRDEILAPN